VAFWAGFEIDHRLFSFQPSSGVFVIEPLI
jgi:hypothetical protein